MKWVIYLGTKENPKKQKHNKIYDNEAQADLMVAYLKATFNDLEITKEKIE